MLATPSARVKQAQTKDTGLSVPSWLWIVFTLVASTGQTARNAMQRDLIATLGAPGATTVRFLFGLPFALLFLPVVLLATGTPPRLPTAGGFAWTAAGAVAQIGATGLMLMAMESRSFVVAIAYTKTEPVLVALFGLIFLGDRLTPLVTLAIVLATAGVLLMSWPKRSPVAEDRFTWRPAIYGVASAAGFALSAVGYRAGTLSFGTANFLPAATTTLVVALTLQSALIVGALAVWNRPLLAAIFRQWRPSLLAGFVGAFSSQFWFLAFAIDSAARVRTLALVEIIFAQIVSRKLFGQTPSFRELGGVALMAVGVAMLVAG